MPNPIESFIQYLQNRPGSASNHTVQNYRLDLQQFGKWFEKTTGETLTAEDVTPVDIKNYKDYLLQERKFKPATINRKLSTLRAFFEWAIEKGQISNHPVRVKNVEETPPAARSINERDFAKMLRMAQKHGTPRDVAIVQLIRHTGLRAGEVCSLELEDIEISERKGTVIVRSGKGKRYREIPLNLDVRRALEDYLEARPKVADPHLFIGQKKTGIVPGTVYTTVRKFARFADIDNVTPHTLRHTFGRSLIDKGIDLPTVQKLMGHKRIDSTIIYTQPSQDDLAQAVATLEAEEL